MAARDSGFYSVVLRYPAVEVVLAAHDAWTRAGAQRQMAASLGVHPDLRGIFAQSDALALGALDALAAAGREDVVVVGFNGHPEAIEEVRSRRLAATVSQRPCLLGSMVMDVAIALANGEEAPAEVRIDPLLVTSTTAEQALAEFVALVPHLARLGVSNGVAEPYVHQFITASSVESRQVLLNRAVSFMREHFEHPIDVGDLAAAMSVSRSHLYEVFAEHGLETPANYLMRLRLEFAKECLMRTEMSVAEVCRRLHWQPSTFYRIFKREIGLTPAEFARRLNGRPTTKQERVGDKLRL